MLMLGRLASDTALLIALLGATGGVRAEPISAVREQMHEVPVHGSDGIVQPIPMRLCLPQAGTPAPLALLNHGMPRDSAERARYAPYPCDAEPVRWFLAQGFAVAMPLRRGYGAAGGPWAEAFSCTVPDFAAVARESARDMEAAIGYARSLTDIDATRPAVIVGQSAGGWGVLALASRNLAGVGAVVNFASGIGGRAQRVPNTNCRVDLLAQGAGQFGATARIPSL